MKRSAAFARAWLRLGGFFSLVAILLMFGMTSAATPNLPHEASAPEADDGLVSGDDLFTTLSLEGVDPSETLPPDPQPAKKGTLPVRVDNSKTKYFPPVMQQKGGSCGQASGIHYGLAYELNFLRDLDGKLLQNQYPDHWTWNCLNDANGKGSFASAGWTVVRDIGIPTLDVYGDKFAMHNNYAWPSGYAKYYAAMKNRVESLGTFPIRTAADLEKVKAFLHNHNDPNHKHGGLLNFDCNFKGHKKTKIPAGSYEAGKTLVTGWGDGGAHAMTYVGYDDNIAFDVNKDGKITNDADITGDGKVDLADMERGAFIFVNSHGTKYGDGGFAYVQYRTNGLPTKKGGLKPSASWVKVKKDYQPQTTLMLRFSFSERSALKLSAGFASSATASQPAKTFAPGVYNGKSKVGSVPMRGKGLTDPIEIGLDLTTLASTSTDGKFFLNLGRKSGSKATGELLAACIYRYDATGRVMAVHNFTIADGKFGEKALELTVVSKR